MRRLLAALALLLLALPGWAALDGSPLLFGVLAFRPKAQAVEQWQPLAAYLEATLGRPVELRVYGLEELSAAVAQNAVDVVLTNPGHFILLRQRNSLSAPVATRISRVGDGSLEAYGGVVFTLAERRDIASLADLAGQRIAVSGVDSLGGYQAQAFELLQAGAALPAGDRLLVVGMPHDLAVEAVLDGRADAGFAASGVLESLAREGKLELGRVKLIHRQNLPSFPYAVSTRLYPEWPVAVTPRVDGALARRLTVALLSLAPDSAAARAAGIQGFAVPANYGGVESLLRELRLPPFDAPPTFTARDVWARYRYPLLALAAALGAVFALSALLLLANRRLAAARREARESEAKQAAILDNVGACIYIKDTGYRYRFANRAVCELFGAPVEAVVGREDGDFFDAATAANIRENDRRVIEGGERLETTDTRRIENSGEARAYLSVKLPLRDPDGEIYALCGIATDITERMRAEAALQESERRFRLMADSAPVMIWIAGVDKRCFWFNKVWLTFTGRTLEQEMGEGWAEGVHPDDLPACLATYFDCFDRRQPFTMEYRLRRHDGEYRWLSDSGIPRFGDDGAFVGYIGSCIDITCRKQAEQALAVSEAFAKATIDAVSAHICVLDKTGTILAVNQAWRDFYDQNDGKGFDANRPGHCVGANYLAVCDAASGPLADEAARMAAGLRGVINGELDGFAMQYPCHSPDAPRWFLAKVTRFHGGSGNLVVAHENITERKLADDRLQLAASVFSHAREGIAITDADAMIIDVNSAFTRITGYSREEVVGKNPSLLKSGRQPPEFYAKMWHGLAAEGYWCGEIWNQRKSGEIYAEMLTISAVRDALGETQNYVALFSDITPIKQQQQQLERIAHYDALTNLPNRMLLADRLRQAMAQAQRRGCSLAVVYLDLDGFKAVNDRHGHDIGDELLIVVSHRMKAALREGDTLARIGGDEFVGVLVDLEQPDDYEPVVVRLLEAAAEPVMVRQQLLRVSASIGVTLYPQDEGDADLLMRHADQAMYVAKQAGKNRQHMFDVAQDEAARSQQEIVRRVRQALDRGEFLLHYQPQVNLRTGEVVGAEALIRWLCPERGLLLPADFLPSIGSHPLGVELGEWVIGSALAQMAQWRAGGLDIPVSVNIAGGQLQQDGFVARLRDLLAAHPSVPASRLELEILESSALEDIGQAIQVICACREIGVRFALDDFGTGYSSLAYLKRLPVETLKIDQSFVRDMLVDAEDLAIVEGVAGLAAAFRRQVIAEGVESLAHGRLLLPLGCKLAQGNGIAPPMPAADLPGWVAAWQAETAWETCRAPASRPPVSA